MIDLIQKRRKILAFTGVSALILGLTLLLLPPDISPSLQGGAGMEYRIHAVFQDKEEQQLAEASLIQTASDTLERSVSGSLMPSSNQEDLWLLQLRVGSDEKVNYAEFQQLSYTLINSFPGWTFQTSAGISQSRGAAVRSTTNCLLCLVVLLGIAALYLLLRCRRLQSLPAGSSRTAGDPVQPAGNDRLFFPDRHCAGFQYHTGCAGSDCFCRL